MRANGRSGQPLASRDTAKSVYVSLEALYPPHEGSSTVEGLQLRGWAPGALQRWMRSTSGQWIGVVTFFIELSDGTTFKAVDQLVPADALRPRS